MNNYSIALFLHIVGSIGFCVVLGLEWIGLWQIRKSVLPEEVHVWMKTFKSTTLLGSISMLMTILTGFYMMLTVWGSAAWILVVLGALVLEIVIFLALSKPRIAAIGQTLAAEKRPSPQTFHNLVNDPLLWISVQTRIAIILGIIFLKIAKPDLAGSLLTIGVSLVLGLAAALPIPLRERAQAGPAD